MLKYLFTVTLLVLGSGTVFADQTLNYPAEGHEWIPFFEGLEGGPEYVKVIGDPKTEGPASFLVKSRAGRIGSLHAHTATYRAVVIQGTVVNNQAVQNVPIPLGPGSHWIQPGGARHTTSCVSDVDCISYVQFEDTFDAIFAE